MSDRSTSQEIEPNDDFEQTSPDEYLKAIRKNGTLKGVVHARSVTPMTVKI